MKSIKDCIITREVKEVSVVNMVIEVNNNHICRKDGWTYLHNYDINDSRIEYIAYEETMERNYGIEGYNYFEWDCDVKLMFRFINIQNKTIEEYQGMVDEIAKYIYNVRDNKSQSNTVKEIKEWLDINLSNIIQKYR